MSPTLPGYNLIWSDEFNGPAGSLPDESKWEIITRIKPNEGNEELQRYIRDKWVVSINGESMLHIKPQFTDAWYSARLEGWHSFSCPDGKKLRVQTELRNGTANAANQSGVWPAFWLLGQDFRNNVGWPVCGEIDIFENSHGHDWVISTVHYGSKVGPDSIGKPENRGKHYFDKDSFNVWAVEIDRRPASWKDETMIWYRNGLPYQRLKGSNFETEAFWNTVAHKPMFPILNVAIGGKFLDTGLPITSGTDMYTGTGLASGLQVKYVAFYVSQ